MKPSKIQLLILITLLTISTSFSQNLPFVISDTIKYKTVYSTEMELSHGSIPSHQTMEVLISLLSMESNGNYTLYWNCLNRSNSASENKLRLDIAINEALLNFPIHMSYNSLGEVISMGDTIELKNVFLERFMIAAKKNEVRDEIDGLNGYLGVWEENGGIFSISERFQAFFPEAEILGKAIAQLQVEKGFTDNDKFIFNDVLYDENDTIRLNQTKSLKIQKNKNGLYTSSYKKEVSEADLKAYVIEKYPLAWKSAGYSDEILTPFKDALNNFKPEDSESLDVNFKKKTHEILSINFTKKENYLMMGGTTIQCEFKR